MSLYLCVFDGEQEMEGVEVGSYASFNSFRSYVVREIEGGVPGAACPTLVLHSDCDGQWPVDDCVRLRSELGSIRAAMVGRPPVTPAGGLSGPPPVNALESFRDVDGQLLVERMQALVEVAIQRGRPILFQ
jgi:hypothetical protein